MDFFRRNAEALKIQIHCVLVPAIDVIRPGNDFLLKATQIIPKCIVAAIHVEGMRATIKLIGAHFACIDDIYISVLPSHFAIAPEPFCIVKCDLAFNFADIA